jgi:hypothetical protein
MNAVSVIGSFTSLQCAILLLTTAIWWDFRMAARRQRLLRRLSEVLDSRRDSPLELGAIETSANRALPLRQNAPLTHGPQTQSGGNAMSLELQPLGDDIVCTPTMSSWMVPFHLSAALGEPVTITWDHELSRYLVTTSVQRLAA